MRNPDTNLPPRLQEIIEDFSWSEGREKLELLIQYADKLPPLPDWLRTEHESMEPVPECMTPVFIHAEGEDGKIKFYLDVPKESPTVRGFAAILSEGLLDLTPEQVIQIPGDFFLSMGLHDVLTHQRMNGISAILAHMKQLAVRRLIGQGKDQS